MTNNHSGKYIDRESAIEATWEILNGLGYSQKVSDRLVEEVEAVFDAIPAADVAPVRHGRWIYEVETDAFHCTLCNGMAERKDYRYCPWCGAKMEETE